MRFNRLVAIVGIAWVSLVLTACPTPPIEVESGAVIGLRTFTARGPVEVFKGIPYAAPPVGALRWRAPEPPVPWEGVRIGFFEGAACVQPGSSNVLPSLVPKPEPCEDCLFLNIWRPADSGDAPLPVMVWIHGGSFENGQGAELFYDGSALAAQGVLVVTINYRLGALGFLAHPAFSAENAEGISGNYGLLDQIAALEWVGDNIAAFGGDPGNVTIFGESAGSMSVGCLLVAPPAAGLFHRAIMQSGVPWPAPVIRSAEGTSAEAEGLAWAAEFGITGTAPSDAAALRALAPEDILGVDLEVDPLAFRLAFTPTVDGVVLPDQPLLMLLAGDFHPVPLLIGSNRDEGTLFLLSDQIPSDYEAFLQSLFGEDADAVLALYPSRPGFVTGARNRLFSDFAMFAPSQMAARGVASQEPRVYQYYFTKAATSLPGELLGAHHAGEIPFVFGSLFGRSALAESDRALARAMQQYWTRFAATGNPNDGVLPVWPAYDPATKPFLELGDVVQADADHLEAATDVLEGILVRLYEAAGTP